MRLKPKRRLILLLAVVLVLGATAFALVYVRSWQRERMTDQFFQKGQEAFKNGELYQALDNTGQYLNRIKTDQVRRASSDYADALYVYAESRRRIEEADGRNLGECVAFYQQYLDRRPDDAATRMTLLKTLVQAGLFPEARDLAAKMRPAKLDEATAEHIPVLREESVALLQSRALSKDGPLDRLLSLDPLDLRGNIVQLAWWVQQDNRGGEIERHAESILKDHPDDPRALVIAAYAEQIKLTEAGQKASYTRLCQAAGIDPKTGAKSGPVGMKDAEYAKHIIDLFDTMRRHDESLLVLREAAEQIDDQELMKQFIRRLWQDGATEEVLARTESLNPADRGIDSDILAFRAMVLQRDGKKEQAQAIVGALATRQGDYRARGWSMALPLIAVAEEPATPERITAWKEAITQFPNEPVLLAYYGDALSRLSRNEEAREAWRKATEHLSGWSWPLPIIRTAESLMADNRPDEAARAADAAVAMAPARIYPAVVRFEAHAARIQLGSRSEPTAAMLLEQIKPTIEELDKQAAEADGARVLRQRLVIPHVLFLARTDKAEEARREGDVAIHAEPPMSPELLQRLAAISASERLGLEQQAMARVEALAGKTTSVAFVNAMEAARDGRPEEGLRLLKEAAAASPNDIGAQLAVPRYLERIGHEDAPAAWKAVAERFPKDLETQRATLLSPAACTDAKFVEDTIGRYSVITGSEPSPAEVVAHSARARAAMSGTPGRQQRDQAVALLSAVVTAQPTLAEPRAHLASVLAHADPGRGIEPDLARAAALLAQAAALDPRNSGIALQLGDVYRRQGDLTRAREQFNRVASDSTLPQQIRWAAAKGLIAMKEVAPVALNTLRALYDEQEKAGSKVESDLLVDLAGAYASQSNRAEADRFFGLLADGAAADPESIFFTCRYFYLEKNDAARGDAVAARLDAVKTDPGVKEFVRARLSEVRNQFDEAAKMYEAAVSAAPKRADIWEAYIGMLLRGNDPARAVPVAERGARANPDVAALRVLYAQAIALADPAKGDDLGGVIEALSSDPSLSVGAEVVRAIQRANSSGELQSIDGLRKLSEQFPAVTPLQIFVAKRLVVFDPVLARMTINRAMATNPTDPSPAKAAAEIHLQSGQWQDMFNAADAWRKRDLSRPVEADIAYAQACLKLDRFVDGLSVLEPRLEAATADPDAPASLGVLNIYSMLLVAGRREADARKLLAPLLPTSKGVRMSVWRGVATEAVQLDVATAKVWIGQLSEATPKDDADEQLALAMSYYSMIRNPPQPEALELVNDSIREVKKLVQTPGLETAAAHEMLGVLHHQIGNPEEAKAHYEKAIALDPDRAIALNNLANIEAEAGDLPRALALATRAVKVAETDANCDTLAMVHASIAAKLERESRREEAVRSYRDAAEAYWKAWQLNASSWDRLVMSAQMADNAGDLPAAISRYQVALTFQGVPADAQANIKNNLAMALSNQGDHGQALPLIADVVRQFPNIGEYADTQGWIELGAGNREQAISAFRNAIAKAATDDKKVTPSIGLAIALAGGSAEQRVEAAALLDAVRVEDADWRNKGRYQRARDALKAPQ